MPEQLAHNTPIAYLSLNVFQCVCNDKIKLFRSHRRNLYLLELALHMHIHSVRKTPHTPTPFAVHQIMVFALVRSCFAAASSRFLISSILSSHSFDRSVHGRRECHSRYTEQLNTQHITFTLWLHQLCTKYAKCYFQMGIKAKISDANAFFSPRYCVPLIGVCRWENLKLISFQSDVFPHIYRSPCCFCLLFPLSAHQFFPLLITKHLQRVKTGKWENRWLLCALHLWSEMATRLSKLKFSMHILMALSIACESNHAINKWNVIDDLMRHTEN